MPTEPDSHSLAAVRAALAGVGSDVLAAQTALDQGGNIDLAGMDARMQQLCADTLALTPAQARRLLPELLVLHDAVAVLIETLTDRGAL